MNNSEIIERMKTVADMKEDQDLAKFFEISKSTIANWRRGTSISVNYLVAFSTRFGVSLDFLIYGKSAGQALSTHEKMALIAFNELSDRQKIQALAMMGNLAANGLIPPSVQLNQIGGTHNRQHVGDE